MVLPDANVLLYAVNTDMPQHASSKRWIEETLSGNEAVGLAWIVQLAFVRLATLPVLLPTPLPTTTALDVLDDWLSARPSAVVTPIARQAILLRGLRDPAGTA